MPLSSSTTHLVLIVLSLRAKCRRLKMQYDIQMIIIDYLQLMSGGGENKGGNREQEVSAISRALKGLAKELERACYCPVTVEPGGGNTWRRQAAAIE